MKNLLTPRRIWILALLSVGIAVGFFYWKSQNGESPMVLQTAVAQRTNILVNITATGRVQPIDQVEIGTEVSGTVSKIYADFNQNVRKGQILLELDKKKAASKVDQVYASYTAAQNEEQYQKSVLERTQKLVQNGGATSVELETALYKYNAAQSSLSRVRNELAQARMDLANCTIKSPIDGVVLSRNVEVGQTVAASMSTPTLFIIARNLERMEVKADVDEADIGHVKVGQKASFTVDAHPEDSFQGEVSEVRLSPTITSNVVTYTVVIQANNESGKLLPGMTATCDIVVKNAHQVIALPLKALQFQPSENTPGYTPPAPPIEHLNSEGATDHPARKVQGKGKNAMNGSNVWVQQADGQIKPRRVKVGINDGVHVEIVEGLSEGEITATGESRVVESSGSESPSSPSSPFMPKRPSKKSSGGPPPHM